MAGRPKLQQKDKKSQQVAVRMPMSLIKRIDAFAADLQQKTPGMHITRADAIRVIIEGWLAKTETEPDSASSKSARKE